MKMQDFSTLLMARPQLAEAMRRDFGLFCSGVAFGPSCSSRLAAELDAVGMT